MCDIKKNCGKILWFKHEMLDIGVSRKAKVMKLGYDVQHTQSYLYVVQAKADGRCANIWTNLEQKGSCNTQDVL